MQLKRSRAGKKENHGFVIFLAAMAGMTVISRMGDSLMVPQVEVGPLEEMALEYPVEIEGRIGTKEKKIVYCEENLCIAHVPVQKNDMVQKGDLLFSIDLEDLDEKIRQAELEVRKIELQIADLENDYEKQVNQQRRNLSRAEADYNEAAEAAANQENTAYADMEKARMELEQHERLKPDEERKRNFKEDSGEKNTKKGDSEESSEKEDSGEGDTLASWNQKEKELRQKYEEKKKLYEEATAAGKEAVKMAKRQIEDAGEEVTESNAASLQRIEKEELERNLGRLRDLRQKEGRVYAECDGRVLECAVSAGSFTTPEPVMILEDFSQSFQFEGITAEGENVPVEEGTKCRIEMTQGNVVLEDVAVSQVTEEEEGAIRVTAQLDSGSVFQSGSAVLSFTKESRRYQNCIPKSAVYQEDSGYYVIGVKESSTILGIQWTAQHVPVTLLESNEEYAAVSGDLSEYDKIVFRASKKVEGGDRVRIIDRNGDSFS